MKRKDGKNLGNLICFTLFVPSGTINMVVFLKAKVHSHSFMNSADYQKEAASST
jgi:hypothetical protein